MFHDGGIIFGACLETLNGYDEMSGEAFVLLLGVSTKSPLYAVPFVIASQLVLFESIFGICLVTHA